MKHLGRAIVLANCFISTSLSWGANITPSLDDCRCLPSQSCWPDEQKWRDLAKHLDGKLFRPDYLTAACQQNVKSESCIHELKNMKNPFFVQSNAGGTQTQGWLNAWDNVPSIYAVEAKTTNDIVEAVKFAQKYNLRLVIKGGGHDYLGRSSAPDSLLVWTHDMRKIDYQQNFIPTGAGKNFVAIPVITAEAGSRWIDAYTVATSQHDKYVQGGGCASVGVAGGFSQGGGFGSFSKKFGTGAAGIVQVEVVTADGKILIANEFQNQDLFWAIRGGGGGSYGVVTKMTLKLHDLPSSFGIFKGDIHAANDDAYKNLIKKYLEFYQNKLNNEHWGEQFSFNKADVLNIFLVSQGINESQAQQIWQPFITWVKSKPDSYTITTNYITIPANKMWDYTYWEKTHPELVTKNTSAGARDGEFWWTPNTGEVSQYIYTYQSWWLPESLFVGTELNKLSEAFFTASRVAPVSVHINKGLAGAAQNAVNAGAMTSTNPSVYQANALVLMSATKDKVYKGVSGYSLDTKLANESADAISKSMNLFMKLAPNSGTYVNEADYFQSDWQQVFWGANYARLFAIKQQYDPQGLFYCHHCVGSELWNNNGICKIKAVNNH